MKYTLLIILVSVATLIKAQPPVYIAEAAIEVNDEVYDFGEVSQTEKGEFIFCDFEVTNIGSEPLIISKCKGSCGCTTPECNKTPIGPKSTSNIKVRYDSNRLGTFSKKVTIFSNAANESEKTVTIKGTVIAKS